MWRTQKTAVNSSPNPSALKLTLLFFNRLGVDKSYQKEQTTRLKRLSWFMCRWIYSYLKQLPITKLWSAKRHGADNPKIVGSNCPVSHSLQSWTWWALWILLGIFCDSLWMLPSGAPSESCPYTHIYTLTSFPVCPSMLSKEELW